MKVYEGKMDARGMRFGIVVSRFNEFIGGMLKEGCIDTLIRHNAETDNICLFYVPGGFEIPQIAYKLARKKTFDAVICLGAVIRGDTPHFEYIAQEVSKGIAKASMDTDTPVIFGVITADNIEQAIERAGTKSGNKGRDAALSAIEMVSLLREMEKE
ncbi:MAG: 6,7-dimethyl-8-ribityllumazine synthase [bacterium]